MYLMRNRSLFPALAGCSAIRGSLCALAPRRPGARVRPRSTSSDRFFPAWLLCSLLGILLAAVVRVWFVRIKLEPQISPLIVVYPCLAGFFTFTLWLVFFS